MSPSWPGGARYFFLDKKVSKKSSQQEASLPAGLRAIPSLAFALQTGQNHGLLNFAQLRSLIAPASAKSSYAPPALKATIVPPAFARSFLLTAGEKSQDIKKQDARNQT